MNADQIVMQDIQEAGGNGSQFLAEVKQKLASGEALALRSGNSVAILERLENNAAECSIFTTSDGPQAVQEAMDLINKIKQSDIQVIYGQKGQEKIFPVFQMAGLNVTKSDLPDYDWMAVIKE